MLQPTAKRILVVEDEFLIASVIEDVVADLGHACVCARDLPTGLLFADGDVFDAAIIDYVLGRQDAGPLCERLHRIGTSFAIVTGVSQSIAKKWHVPTLAKPFRELELRQLLSTLVDRNARASGSSQAGARHAS
jgi:DNA-binding response OmpR family regulator